MSSLVEGSERVLNVLAEVWRKQEAAMKITAKALGSDYKGFEGGVCFDCHGSQKVLT